MSDNSTDLDRRALLITAATLAVGCVALDGSTLLAAPAEGVGKPGDFNFLAGNWKISNRQLKANGEWDEFPGESTCWTVLGGVASIEELRIPARKFSGMGIRILDVEKRVWSDFWVKARSGVLGCPGMEGVFKDGVGTFIAEDVDDGHPIQARGVWDRITAKSCRWRQGVSRDGGKTWKDNWFMDWVRV